MDCCDLLFFVDGMGCSCETTAQSLPWRVQDRVGHDQHKNVSKKTREKEKKKESSTKSTRSTQKRDAPNFGEKRYDLDGNGQTKEAEKPEKRDLGIKR